MWKVEGEREQAKRKKVREHQSSHGHTLIPAADVAALGQTKRGPVGGRSVAMHCLRDSFFSTHRHKAILDYLHANNFMSAFHSLRADTGSDYTPDPSSKSRAILEKKWTTVIRLQKKEYLFISFLSRGPLIPFLIQILDLESRNAALQDDLSTAPAKRANHTDWLPRNPPAHTLTSHRAPITQVAFHPQYSVLASASEDATVKIWDWETGEFERTLKGHTKSVNDLNFDHKGHLLGISSLSLLILSVHPHQSLAPPTSSSRYGILNPSTKTQRPSLATNIPSLPFASCQVISTSSAPAETRPSDYSTFHQRTHSLVLFLLHPPGSFSFQPPNPHHFWPFRMGPMRYPFFRWQNHRQLFQRPSPLPPCSSLPFTLPSPSCIYIDHQNLGSPHRRAETRIQRS